MQKLDVKQLASVIVNSLLFFSQEKTIKSLAILTNGHTCRSKPTAATEYSLHAIGEIWARFRSVFYAELISETDAAAASTEPLEITVDFSEDEVAIVSLGTIYLLQFESTRIFHILYICLILEYIIKVLDRHYCK